MLKNKKAIKLLIRFSKTIDIIKKIRQVNKKLNKSKEIIKWKKTGWESKLKLSKKLNWLRRNPKYLVWNIIK